MKEVLFLIIEELNGKNGFFHFFKQLK